MMAHGWMHGEHLGYELRPTDDCPRANAEGAIDGLP
jgi:hypothetical protein